MEASPWIFNSSTAGDDGNPSFTNTAWDVITPSYAHWTNSASTEAASVAHALLFSHQYCMPDPHMMCLKLGRRHYCGDSVVPDRHVTAEPPTAPRRGVARCQVEGCHVALGNAKEYYRKHKVCEIHSKAPKVVVAGVEQRFCQQCSRFHRVTEFDEAKRSCRKRLRGHNQRRRKGSRFMRLLPPSPSSAFSLLSETGDLSSRCSAALYELIAANRATSVVMNQTQMMTGEEVKPLEFGLLSMEAEWSDCCWSSFGGANVI